MKVCPRCQKTYTDDNLNFCLEDGSVLSQAGNAPMPETVLINQPRITASNQPGGQPGGQASWGSSPQQYSMQPAGKIVKNLGMGLVNPWRGGIDLRRRRHWIFCMGCLARQQLNSKLLLDNYTKSVSVAVKNNHEHKRPERRARDRYGTLGPEN